MRSAEYPERRHFGRYLRAVFDQLRARAPEGVEIRPIRGAATALRRAGGERWLIVDHGRERPGSTRSCPPTNAEIDAALAAAAGVGALRRRPPGDGPLARSQRVSIRTLREATGWAPRVRAGTEGGGLVAG